MKQYNLNTFSEFAELKSEVELERRLLNYDKLRLSNTAINTYKKRGGAAAFRRLCGDTFVLGKILGAEFSAMLRVSSMTSDEQVSNRMKMSGSNGSVSGNVSDYSYFKTLQSQKQLDAEIIKKGPLSALPKTDFASLHEYVLNFPEYLKKEFVKQEIDTKNPDSPKPPPLPIKGWITGSYYPLLVKAGLDALPPSRQEAQLEEGFQYLRALMVSRADMGYVNNHPEQFGIFNQEKHKKRMADLEKEIARTQAWGRKCLSNTMNKGECEKLTQVTVPRTPQRAYPYFYKTNKHPVSSNPLDEMIPNPRDRGFEPQLVPQHPWRYPGEKRVFQLIGEWIYHEKSGVRRRFNEFVAYCIQEKDTKTCDDSSTHKMNTGQPILIPYQSDVYVIIIDNYHKDNNVYWDDPLRARITDQLYPGDLE